MVAGDVISSDATHGHVILFRNPARGIHAFFEYEWKNGKMKLTGANEAIVASGEKFYEDGKLVKNGCIGCHTSAAWHGDRHIGVSTGAGFFPLSNNPYEFDTGK